MITQTYDLDMTPGGEPLRIHLNQRDANFSLRLRLFSDAGQLNIESGTSATIRGTTPGGRGYNAYASISNGIVTVTGNANITDAAGVGVYEICLTKNNKELYSSNFYIIVEPVTRN